MTTYSPELSDIATRIATIVIRKFQNVDPAEISMLDAIRLCDLLLKISRADPSPAFEQDPGPDLSNLTDNDLEELNTFLQRF